MFYSRNAINYQLYWFHLQFRQSPFTAFSHTPFSQCGLRVYLKLTIFLFSVRLHPYLLHNPIQGSLLQISFNEPSYLILYVLYFTIFSEIVSKIFSYLLPISFSLKTITNFGESSPNLENLICRICSLDKRKNFLFIQWLISEFSLMT